MDWEIEPRNPVYRDPPSISLLLSGLSHLSFNFCAILIPVYILSSVNIKNFKLLGLAILKCNNWLFSVLLKICK